jgi:hypothetical protein
MIEEKKLDKELKRLLKLPFAPQDEEEIDSLMAEYRRIAQRDAKSLAHFLRAVDRLIDSASRVPPPAELVQSLRETPVPEREAAPLGCGTCNGTGWRSFQKWVSPAGVEPYMADYADFCACDRGIFMRKADAARKEEQAAKRRSKGSAA